MPALYILLYLVVGLLIALGWQYLITFFAWTDTDPEGRMTACVLAWPFILWGAIIVGGSYVLVLVCYFIFGNLPTKVRNLAKKHRGC